mgnify:CR=1 FL=1
MDKKDYERSAILLAELASLAMREGDCGKAETYLKEALLAIEKARKAAQ